MKMYGGSEETHLTGTDSICGCGCAVSCNGNSTLFTKILNNVKYNVRT
jgi:hypothetical protein